MNLKLPYRYSRERKVKRIIVAFAALLIAFLVYQNIPAPSPRQTGDNDSQISSNTTDSNPATSTENTNNKDAGKGLAKKGSILKPISLPAGMRSPSTYDPFYLVSPKAVKLELSAPSAILIDQNSGAILYSKNIYTEREIASLTKIMTGYIAAKELDLDDVITASKKSADQGGSELYLTPGEKIKATDLIYGLMLRSANDGAVALAEHLSGSEKNFVKKMNAEVSELGLKQTRFYNPNGLSRNTSTAYDMALISQKAMSDELFSKIVGTTSYDIPWPGNPFPRSAINHNKLLTRYDFITGIKTGFTNASGNCLAASAEKDDMKLISIVLGAPTPEARSVDTMNLFNYGFDNYEMKQYFNAATDRLSPIVTHTYPPREIDPIVQDDLELIALKGETSEQLFYSLKKDIDLPIKEGSPLGEIGVVQNDKMLISAEVRSLKSVQAPTFIDKVSYFFTSLF